MRAGRRSSRKTTERQERRTGRHNRASVRLGYRWGAKRTLLVALAASAAGCGGNAGAEVEDVAAAISAPDAADCTPHDPNHDRDHAFHKRCEHYSDRGHYNRRKTGSAQLSVRTMIDSKSAATLEMTTGSFEDQAAAPGAIDEVNVNIPRPSGKGHDELAFQPRPASGSFSTPLGVLAHGQALTVDAIIGGIDRGKDRVSVDDQVQYRPDLAVSHLDVPPTAPLGLPTSMAATVVERMGDLGATADCVLSADGVIVDRVTGIWVDAGGAVTCHFSYAFTTVGQHAVHADVVNVAPGDYDTGNNGADATVSVMPQFTSSLIARDATYAGRDTDEVVDSTGTVLYQDESTWSGSTQSASLSASWSEMVAFPLATVLVSATSGGSTWPLIQLSGVAADSSDPVQGTCAAGGDTTGFNWLTVCTAGTGGGAGATTVDVSEFAGDVTYHSDGVCKQTTSFADCSAGFTWNDGGGSVWATRHPFGDTVSITLDLSDAAGLTLQGSSVASLSAYTSQESVPQTCEIEPDQTQHCYTHLYSEAGVSGSGQ